MVIDLAEAARKAAAKAQAEAAGAPTEVDKGAVAWQSFQALLANDRANGREHPQKVVSVLWSGYSTGFDTGYRVHETMLNEAFKSGALTFGGHAPQWWDELRALAQACVEDPTSVSEAALSEHLSGSTDTVLPAQDVQETGQGIEESI